MTAWPTIRPDVAAFIVCAPSPAHAMLAVALAAHGARLRRDHAEHDGRKLRVAIRDAPTRPGEVTASLVLANPMRAALDVLVACREHGKPVRARVPQSAAAVDSAVAFSAGGATDKARRPGLTRTRSPLPPKGTRS